MPKKPSVSGVGNTEKVAYFLNEKLCFTVNQHILTPPNPNPPILQEENKVEVCK
ncbi:MAG: hypothetical protein HY761_06870 [Candidatus Omnitrophica bacterium]|nr:hypothetical protein [Candidatus Omnitrophota bacterium]